jgi:hypothetical protein
MVYSGAWGKLIHKKNKKSKISWHCPFKSKLQVLVDFNSFLMLSHYRNDLVSAVTGLVTVIDKNIFPPMKPNVFVFQIVLADFRSIFQTKYMQCLSK